MWKAVGRCHTPRQGEVLPAPPARPNGRAFLLPKACGRRVGGLSISLWKNAGKATGNGVGRLRGLRENEWLTPFANLEDRKKKALIKNGLAMFRQRFRQQGLAEAGFRQTISQQWPNGSGLVDKTVESVLGIVGKAGVFDSGRGRPGIGGVGGALLPTTPRHGTDREIGDKRLPLEWGEGVVHVFDNSTATSILLFSPFVEGNPE